MANSSMVSDIKDKVIRELIDDETFFYAVNSPTITDKKYAKKLVNKHIFRYNQNPETLKDAITFLTVQVHIQKINRWNTKDIWIRPVLEIWIYSHESCMKIDNIPDISADRNDYISQLIDDKFNGRTSLGLEDDKNKIKLLGELDLVENSEGAYSPSYLYRKMIFVTKDINDSLCDRS